MKRCMCIVGLFVLALAGDLALRPFSWSQTQAPSPDGKDIAVPPKMSRVQQYIQLLNEEVAITELHQTRKLEYVIAVLSASVKKGQELPIFIDEADFKHENPDAPDMTQTDVKFPDTIKKMSRAAALRLALSNISTDNGTFVVGKDGVRITTLESASLPMLSRRKVVGVFKAQPLEEVLQQLAQTVGVTVLVDYPRAGDKIKTPVTATFTNDVSVKGACEMLAETAGLKCLARQDMLYVTTPEYAQAIQKEQSEQQEKQTKLLQQGPGQPGANINFGGFNIGGGLGGGGFNMGGMAGFQGGFNINPGGLGFGGFGGGVNPGAEADQMRWHTRPKFSGAGIPALH